MLQGLTHTHMVLLANTVAAAPHRFSNLNVLDLSGNRIGDRGLAALDTALHDRALPCMVTLLLPGNSLGPESAALIAAALIRTGRGLAGTLTQLDLSNNPLGCVHMHCSIVYLSRGTGTRCGVFSGSAGSANEHISSCMWQLQLTPRRRSWISATTLTISGTSLCMLPHVWRCNSGDVHHPRDDIYGVGIGKVAASTEDVRLGPSK